jgi:hypothetical protein
MDIMRTSAVCTKKKSTPIRPSLLSTTAGVTPLRFMTAMEWEKRTTKTAAALKISRFFDGTGVVRLVLAVE